jgi:group I intron endonuclease
MTVKSTDTCRIYLLTNTINNKIYVGQTWMHLKDRMGKDGRGYSNCPYLFAAINKYGSENFKYYLIEECFTQVDADLLETKYISQYKSNDLSIGYNLKDGGSHGKHSEESKIKISNTLKNKKWSKIALFNRSKWGLYWKGKKRKPHTEEEKRNLAAKMVEWHANNVHPMTGKEHTEEAKEKIAKANLGVKKPRESVERGAKKRRKNTEVEDKVVSAYNSGDTIKTIQSIFNMQTSTIYRILHRNNVELTNNFTRWTGKTHSEDTKAKMSKAAEERWDKELSTK